MIITIHEFIPLTDQYHTGDVQLIWWEGKLEMDRTKMKKYGVANFHIDYDSFVNSTITDDFGFGEASVNKFIHLYLRENVFLKSKSRAKLARNLSRERLFETMDFSHNSCLERKLLTGNTLKEFMDLLESCNKQFFERILQDVHFRSTKLAFLKIEHF